MWRWLIVFFISQISYYKIQKLQSDWWIFFLHSYTSRNRFLCDLCTLSDNMRSRAFFIHVNFISLFFNHFFWFYINWVSRKVLNLASYVFRAAFAWFYFYLLCAKINMIRKRHWGGTTTGSNKHHNNSLQCHLFGF